MKSPSLAVKIIIVAALCLGLGFLSGLSTTESLNIWYAALEKPSFNPPNWIFGPAWSLLYLLMGIAAALIWHKGTAHKAVRVALLIFVIQFALNLLWSTLFFGLQNPLFALVDIVILWGLILLCIVHFWRINKTAGALLIPYIMWVSFATALNIGILVLN